MSIRSSLVALVAILAVAGPARGQCTCDPNTRKDIVDFSRPPSKVEAQNKVRVSCQPDKDAKTGALTVEVQGQAYFPDGTVIVITARHWKTEKPFASVRAAVKDRVFSAKLGPFNKAIPAGGIVVGAFFIESAQTDAMQKQLIKEHYYRNTPPCKHDKVSSAEAQFSTGGADAEAVDEKAEKDEIAAAKKRLMDAKGECDKVLAAVEQKAKANNDALEAIKRLEEDLKAAAEVINRWSRGRQTLLFSNRFQQLAKLRDLIRDGAKFRAVAAGVNVPNFNGANAATRKEEVSADVTKLADELKGFIDDPRALDAAWDASRPAPDAAPKETPKETPK